MGVFAAAFVFCALLYLVISTVGIALYGSNVKSNILINICDEASARDIQAKLIRVVYLLIPLFNIPPLFITAKDSFLSIYTEFRSRVMISSESSEASSLYYMEYMSESEQRYVAIILLLLTAFISIVLEDVGTVSHQYARYFFYRHTQSL